VTRLGEAFAEGETSCGSFSHRWKVTSMSLLYIAAPWALIIATVAVFYRDKYNNPEEISGAKKPSKDEAAESKRFVEIKK
jgi:hypothetical protein